MNSGLELWLFPCLSKAEQMLDFSLTASLKSRDSLSKKANTKQCFLISLISCTHACPRPDFFERMYYSGNRNTDEGRKDQNRAISKFLLLAYSNLAVLYRVNSIRRYTPALSHSLTHSLTHSLYLSHTHTH